MSADASDLAPFKKPLPPGRLTGKKEGSRNSCDVNFSNPTKNMANKGCGIRESSGSDQDGFSDQNQAVAPSCTDADSASDSNTAVLAAVKEGCEVKARTDCEVIKPHDEGYASVCGKPNSMGVAWSET